MNFKVPVRRPAGTHTTAIRYSSSLQAKGFVANESEKREIAVGDVVQIKAGERHWHGASERTRRCRTSR